MPSQRLFGVLTAPLPPGEMERLLANSSGAGQSIADPSRGAAVGSDRGRGQWIARNGSLLIALAGRPRFTDTTSPDPANQFANYFRTNDVAALERLHGTFAVAVVDTAARRAVLAIDRMGIEAMSYGSNAGTFAFGTRADGVAAFLGKASDIDPQAIFDYLFFHMVPAPQSVFRGVSKLLPGQFVEYRDGELRCGFYWRMSYVDTDVMPPLELAQRFNSVLPAAVGRQLDGERTGTFLSGGTDSTAVTGMLSRLQPDPVDAYSIGFDAEGFDEMEYARIAASRYRVKHHAYYVTPQDVVATVPRIAAAYDEPFGNASAVGVYYCARQAQQDGVRLLLAGDGGDELFGGNARYAKQKVFEAYGMVPGVLRRALVEPLLLKAPGLPRLPLVGKARSYVEQARIPLPDRLESYNFLLRTDLDAMLEADFHAAVSPEHPLTLLREVYQRTPSRSAINRMMHLDLKITLSDNDLRKVSTMCRLAGIEVGYPMLDDDVVALSGLVPPSGKVKGLRLRHFFKEALKDFLPPEILAKEKHGFGLPFGLWMLEHRPLRDLAGDSLATFRSRKFLQPAYIDQLLSQQRSGHASYYGVMVWVIMMLEQWFESRSPMLRQRPAHSAAELGSLI